MKPTTAQAKALAIVAAHPRITPAFFAQQMWPESRGWFTMQNVGLNGATRGVGIVRSGGAYLRRLWAARLLNRSLDDYGHWHYWLSKDGEDLLAAAGLEQESNQ